MAPGSGQELVTLGKYLLIGYLAQIALLQVVVISIGGKPERWLGVLAAALTTTVLLFFVIRAVDRSRRKSRPMDLIYRAIFA